MKSFLLGVTQTDAPESQITSNEVVSESSAAVRKVLGLRDAIRIAAAVLMERETTCAWATRRFHRVRWLRVEWRLGRGLVAVGMATGRYGWRVSTRWAMTGG